MFYWIYDMPNESLAILMAAVFVGFYWIGCILVRPIMRMFVRSRAGVNDIVGHALSCFCVFYGLLLGLLARAVVGIAARRHAARTEKALTRSVATVADDLILTPVARLRDDYLAARANLAEAARAS